MIGIVALIVALSALAGWMLPRLLREAPAAAVGPPATEGTGETTQPRPSVLARIAYVRKHLGPFARAHRRFLVLGTLGTLSVVACRLAFPWPLRGMIELSVPGSSKGKEVVSLVPGSGDPLVWLAGAFIFLAVLQGFSEMVQRVSFARFAMGLVRDARSAAITQLASRRGEVAQSGEAGDLIARVIGDSSRIKSNLKGVLVRLTQSGTFFIGVCAMLCVIDPYLGLAFVVGGAMVVALAYWGATRATEIARRSRKREGRLLTAMQQLLTDPEAATGDTLPGVRDQGERAEAQLARLEGFVIWGTHALLAMTSCLVLVLGISRVRAGHLHAGDLTVVVFYLLMVHNPTVRAGRQAVRVGRLLASAERLSAVLEPVSERPRVPDAPPQEWDWVVTTPRVAR